MLRIRVSLVPRSPTKAVPQKQEQMSPCDDILFVL